MKPYSQDLRKKIVQAYQNKEGSIRGLADRFSVSFSTVWSLSERYRATGSVRPKPHAGGRVSVMNKERLSVLRELVGVGAADRTHDSQEFVGHLGQAEKRRYEAEAAANRRDGLWRWF